MTLVNQELNRGKVVSKKRKHCNQTEAPTKTKGAEFINTKATHYVQAIQNRNKLKPHRPPKAKRKNLNGSLFANNSGTIYQRKVL